MIYIKLEDLDICFPLTERNGNPIPTRHFQPRDDGKGVSTAGKPVSCPAGADHPEITLKTETAVCEGILQRFCTLTLQPGSVDFIWPLVLEPGDNRHDLVLVEFLSPGWHIAPPSRTAVTYDREEHRKRMVPGMPRTIERRWRIFPIRPGLCPCRCTLGFKPVTARTVLLKQVPAGLNLFSIIPALLKLLRGSSRRCFNLCFGSPLRTGPKMQKHELDNDRQCQSAPIHLGR